jgi:hypothetical protein
VVRILTVLALSATLAITGCGGSGSDARIIYSRNQIRDLLRGIKNFANEHDKLPDALTDLTPGHLEGSTLSELLRNPANYENPGYEYVKAGETWRDLTPSTPLIYTIYKGQRDLDGPIGYADGSCPPGKREEKLRE